MLPGLRRFTSAIVTGLIIAAITAGFVNLETLIILLAFNTIVSIFIVFRQPTRAVSPFQVINLLLLIVTVIALIVLLLQAIGPLFTVTGVGGATAFVIGYSIVHREKGYSLGACQACGYDLRQSFERCPECGAEVPTDLARRRKIREAELKKNTQAQTRTRMID